MKLEEFRLSLFNQKINKKNLLGQLKWSDFSDLRKIFKQYKANPLISAFLFKSALPKTLEDLSENKQVGFTNSLLHEINWSIAQFELYKNHINSFLTLKDEFEVHFIKCDFEKAKETLGKVERELGISIWLLENTLLLAEYQEGVKENWSLLSEYSKRIANPYILFSIENLSKRAEKNISYFRFRNLFSNMINDVGFNEVFKEYLCFKFDYFSFNGYSNFATYLFIENQFPIIDKYLTFVDILIEMTVHNEGLEPSDYIQVITTSYQLFDDIRLKQLNNLISKDYTFFSQTKSSIDFFDMYGRQDYQGCINAFVVKAKEAPFIIELYEVYIKCLIKLKRTFINTDLSAFINNILENLFNVYSRNDKNEESTENLLKIAQSFSSTIWAKKLLGLVAKKTNLSPSLNNYQNFSYLNSYINNPRLISLQEKAEVAYKLFQTQFPQSISVSIQAYIASLPISREDLAGAQTSIYEGRRLIKQHEFYDATVHYEKVLTSTDLTICYYEEIIVNLFNCYLEISDFQKALKIFCLNYLRNKYLIATFDSSVLFSKIENTDLNLLGENIELPIFYNIINADFYAQFVAYDTFLMFLNVDKPTDIKDFKPEEKHLYIYFLRNVCKSDIMHYSLWFESSDDIDNERINICRILLDLDPENELEYLDEIAEVTQQSSIRNAIREVNKGRITVNINQLKASEASNIKESFSRFRELASFSRVKDLISIDSTSELLKKYLSNYENETEVFEKVVFTNDPAFITFKIMFLEIRDKFILSKEYGLDGYLSTRIRHGTLKNHIRSLFESLNLITQKDNNGNYIPNNYWASKIISEPLNIKLQEDLRQFSRDIDDLADYIIKELIQVKTEKYQDKRNAWFDYSFPQEQLGSIFKHIRDANFKDYNEFLELITNILIVRTDENLQDIRNHFNTDVKQKFHQIISNLQNSIKVYELDRYLPELSTSILKSNTDIQQELQNIAAWFNLSEQSSNLILNIETIIRTGVEITNSIYPNRKIHPEIVDETDLFLSGAYCPQLIYITRILLDNMITHAKLDSEELRVKISAKFAESKNDSLYKTILILSFSNNLNPETNEDELRDKLDIIKEKFNSPAMKFENINFEGGSGFEKIKKILSIDLNNRKNTLDFHLGDNILEVELSLEITIKTLNDE